jgi:hypothetical protein
VLPYKLSGRVQHNTNNYSFVIHFLLPQTDQSHSRYLVWRNCRGGATFTCFLVAIVYLPLTAAHRAAAFADWLLKARTAQAEDSKDYEFSRSAEADKMEREIAALPDSLPVMAHPAVMSVAEATVPMALEAQLQQAMMQQFATAAEVPDALAGDLLSAAAAAAVVSVEGGNVWDTSMPFSAAVRQRRFSLSMALVILVLIIRAALSILVVVADRRVQVC